MSTHVKPHGFVTKGIHWLSAVLIAYGYYKGLNSIDQLADPALFRFEVAFAAALGLLFVIRLIWTKAFVGATRLTDKAPRWEHQASRAVHIGLYASVFGIVLSGLGIALVYATYSSRGFLIDALVAVHEFSLVALPALLMAHIAGAFWHKVVRRDGILESMTGKLPI